MKNSLGKKVFLLAIAVLITVSVMPTTLFAAKVNAYVNTSTEAAADIVFGVNADKTDYNPGDTVTVKITVDKVPSNGLGISSVGLKLAYDSTKVEFVEGSDTYQLAGKLNIEDCSDAKDADVDADSTDKVITIAGSKDAGNSNLITTTGDFATFKFKVKETTTSGNLGFYVKGTYFYNETLTSRGFSASGVKNEGGVKDIDDSMALFLASNLENVKATVVVTGVSFTESNVSIEKGATADVSGNLVITPVAAEEGASIEWNTGNSSIATVSNTGVITAVGAGTTTITATVGGRTAAMTVKVTVALNGISLSENTMTLYKGDTKSFTVVKDPIDATDVVINSSLKSGEGVVSVNGTTVTGLAEGTAVVQVVANKGTAQEQIEELAVTVKENRITSVSIKEDDMDLLRGKTGTFTFTYTTEEPEAVHPTTDNKTPEWRSSDDTVATVSNTGVVTALKEGTTTITVTVAGKVSTKIVEVTEKHITGVVFDEDAIAEMDSEEFELTTGVPYEIPFTILPEDCTDTLEEILAAIIFEATDNVTVEIEYDMDTKTGKVIVTATEAGVVEFLIGIDGNDIADYGVTLKAVDPIIEEPIVEENPDTGDMSVATMAIMMFASMAGIIVYKKNLVK